jgi:nitrogen-specific signal transduction histidine kinase/DNA-binding response OmpR family regulator
MKTLLVLAKSTGFGEAIKVSLNPQQYRVVVSQSLEQSEQLLRVGFLEGCILDADLNDIKPVRLVQSLREMAPRCPIIIYSGAKQWEWEEEVYLLGVRHILAKPIRARLLESILDRVFQSTAGSSTAHPAAPAPPSKIEPQATAGTLRHTRVLEVIRDFSGVLTHSLSSKALLKAFLLRFREMIGVNRAVIFLREPSQNMPHGSIVWAHRRLRASFCVGLPADLFEHFELSLDGGIGAYAARHGRILKSCSDEAIRNDEIQKEFELLRGQVAIPILDRENLIGVAVFDGRVTEEPFGNEELAFIFHLLEELGLAIKNSWLHDQLDSHHKMMEDILGQLGSACILINDQLEVLHANRTARKFFLRNGNLEADLQFSHLPQSLGSKVFEVLKSGSSLAPFKFHSPESPEIVYRVSVSAFKSAASTGTAVLMLVEDETQSEQAHKLAIENSNLRLIKSMAEHLAHEIGNSLVPISTHQQLLAEKVVDSNARDSLRAVNEAVKRIQRLARQMTFLSGESVAECESVALGDLLQASFEEAARYAKEKNGLLHWEADPADLRVWGDPIALRQAFAEVMLNALQSEHGQPQVNVRASFANAEATVPAVNIQVSDGGKGFTREIAARAHEPFFTTRNVGLGLGLTVTETIITAHEGTLECVAGTAEQGGGVMITLPSGPSRAAGSPRFSDRQESQS